MKKYLHRGLLLLLLAAGLLLAFSPYGAHPGYDYPLVKCTVDIQASPAQVYAYLGNSAHAADWSSFVDHITPLNAGEACDGTVGSFRRCFRWPDEQGTQWDEETVAADSARRRQLTIFNLQGFPLTTKHLLTEQLYEPLPHGRCRLSFTVFLDSNATWVDHLKLHYASYQIRPIFEKNLANIRAINERLVERTR